MSLGMRALFSHLGIAGEIISLRNSLANHPQGLRTSLREAHRRLLTPDRGDGFSRGCRASRSLSALGLEIPLGKYDPALVAPAWVPVQDPDEPRTIEGVLVVLRNYYSTVVFWSAIERVFGQLRGLTDVLTPSRLPKYVRIGRSAGKIRVVRVGVWFPRRFCRVAPHSLSPRL